MGKQANWQIRGWYHYVLSITSTPLQKAFACFQMTSDHHSIGKKTLKVEIGSFKSHSHSFFCAVIKKAIKCHLQNE